MNAITSGAMEHLLAYLYICTEKAASKKEISTGLEKVDVRHERGNTAITTLILRFEIESWCFQLYANFALHAKAFPQFLNMAHYFTQPSVFLVLQ